MVFKSKSVFLAFVVLIGLGLATFFLRPAADRGRAATGRVPLVMTLSFVPDDPTEYYNAHLGEWLATHGLKEGRDYRLKSLSAQGDLGTLSLLMDAARQEQVDILITFQPQTLYNAIHRVPEITKVFSILTSPGSLGAGASDTQHLANVTGFYYWPDYEKLLDLLRECKPATRTVGTLYYVGDDEPKQQLERARQAARDRGLEVLSQPYSSQSEIPDAILALAGQKPDAILLGPCPHQSIVAPGLIKAANALKIPLATMLLDKVRNGTATLAYGVNQEAAAKKFTEILAQVIRGANPRDIPFFNGRNLRYETLVNARQAQAIGLSIPEVVRKRADRIYE